MRVNCFLFFFFFSLAIVAHNAPLRVTGKIIKRGRLLKSLNCSWSERSNFETAVLACMVKPKFGPFSHVGGDDRLIDKVNLH